MVTFNIVDTPKLKGLLDAMDPETCKLRETWYGHRPGSDVIVRDSDGGVYDVWIKEGREEAHHD